MLVGRRVARQCERTSRARLEQLRRGRLRTSRCVTVTDYLIGLSRFPLDRDHEHSFWILASDSRSVAGKLSRLGGSMKGTNKSFGNDQTGRSDCSSNFAAVMPANAFRSPEC